MSKRASKTAQRVRDLRGQMKKVVGGIMLFEDALEARMAQHADDFVEIALSVHPISVPGAEASTPKESEAS